MDQFKNYRLPCGEITTDENLYIDRWEGLSQRLEKLFSSNENKLYVVGVDPNFLLGDDRANHFSIPGWAALNLIKAIDGKLPWDK